MGTKGTKFLKRCTALALIAGMAVPPAFAGNSYQNSYCDAFCDQLVDVKNGQVLGLNGQDGWTAADDEACAMASGASPTPAPMASTTPIPFPSTTAQQFQCQWHAGQALNYCEAYVEPQQSQGFQKVLMVLDLASAAACWTACAYPAAEGACNYSAAAAGVAQFLDSLAVSNSGMNKAIDATLSAAGAAGGVAGFMTASTLTAELPGIPAQTVDGMQFQAIPGTKIDTGIPEQQSHTQKLLACGTAAVMTVLAVMRNRDIDAASETQKNACNAIQGLHSTATTVGTGPGVTPQGAGSGSSSAPLPGAMSAANGPLGNGRQAPSAGCAAGGMGAGGCGMSPQQISSAPDAQILNSGLGQGVASQAAQQEAAMLGALDSAKGSGNPVGQALASAAPNTDIAKAVTTLAAKAQAVPKLGNKASNFSAAGGGGGGGAAASNAQPFNFGFGLDDSAPVAGNAETSFTPALKTDAPSENIFHTGFKGSIFQIISQRMNNVRDRVAQLPWSTPLNRALAGGTDALPPATPHRGGP